jgi:hypothetical protein
VVITGSISNLTEQKCTNNFKFYQKIPKILHPRNERVAWTAALPKINSLFLTVDGNPNPEQKHVVEKGTATMKPTQDTWYLAEAKAVSWLWCFRLVVQEPFSEYASTAY